ncbi:hypothetical protein OK351_17470 [Glutamicibacter sp. MNS18]|uniref:hypothetical protein n=1 Tax=Glutamicibacter sp. MNS18 TaxID=2989817 RepID=UPI002235FE34|nr:hypothetical protein [Glutamicibacter sp. MNS18]MCW4467273.1 hypothetical protein [Glutamicibacter sp. MNS18]
MVTSPRRIQDLHADLVYMRKASGFTSERVDAAGTLRFVLGGDDEPFGALLERFRSAIDSLHDGDSAVLKAAYALEPPYVGMRRIGERRRDFGATIGRGPDTVEGLENTAIKHLLAQLLTGWYPASPLAMRVPELHNGVINESVSMQIVVNDGYWQETREEYRFLAAFDEADYIAISSSVPAIIEPLNDFQVKTERIGQSYSHKFFAPNPMKRGEPYTLAFRSLPISGDADGRVMETSRAFHERTLAASFDAIFLGQQPARIWSFTGLTYFERPGQPDRDSKPTSRDNHHWVSYRDLYGGLFSGIAWQWEENKEQNFNLK